MNGGVDPKGPLRGIVAEFFFQNMEYFVYFLKSTAKNRFYIGYTIDLVKRLKEHNSGRTKSTKPYIPWEVFYSEKFSSRTDACKREWYFKHPKGYLDKISIIRNHGGVA